VSEHNAKNRILEWLQGLGWPKDSLASNRLTSTPPHRVRATLELVRLDVRLSAEAEAWSASEADVAACELVLDELRARHGDLFFDLDALRSDAQAGDALLKLAIYGWDASVSPSMRTATLQDVESDCMLAQRYQEVTASEPWAHKFGSGLGQKMRATVVEAALWRRHRDQFLEQGGRAVLSNVRDEMGVSLAPAEPSVTVGEGG